MNLYSSFYRQIQDAAAVAFPSLGKLPSIDWDHLVSPHSIELPQSVHDRAEVAIHAFYHLSRRPSYRAKLTPETAIPETMSNDSVLMAYDFHVDSEGAPRLIEINTNASSFLIATLMKCVRDGHEIFQSPALADLRRSFETEIGRAVPQEIAIVDDDVLSQKMYMEFLMYRDLFAHWGWSATIANATDLRFSENQLALLGKKINFVYNRTTDFYLSAVAHTALRKAWQTGAAVVSPQPLEYFLLADKQRLIDMSRPHWLKEAGASQEETAAVQAVLIPSYDQTDFASKDELWEKRKTLFFKPKRSYGGKSAYRGESVSRKVFDRILAEDPLIQKYTPAARFPDPDESMKHWKFDLRFYAYRDRIQQIVARIYQGQVTNFATPLGGFTHVRFV